MSDKTGIEWTDATWNPLTGCTKVSPGCDHCYAKTLHERFNGPGSFDTVTLHPERLEQPLRWRKPRRVFVNSMSDLFHESVPDGYIVRTFAVMALAPQHTFQILTKRHARLRSLLSRDDFVRAVAEVWLMHPQRVTYTGYPGWPLPNVWLGVSVENQQWADIRIPALLNTPAAVRFLSCEPLLGPLVLPDVKRLDWVIVGGESGPSSRPMHPEWARMVRDQCNNAEVPFLFKQWGEYVTHPQMNEAAALNWDAKHGNNVYHDSVQWKVGKKAAGRLLDGRTWDEYPERAA